MSTTSKETEECFHYESEEETSNCKMAKGDYSYGCSSETGYEESNELFEINLNDFPLYTAAEDCQSSVFSLDIHSSFKDSVYVAVGDGKSSMEALSWTLKHAVTSSTVVYLVHVFPVMKFIPSPMGKLPRSHVCPEYVNLYLTREKDKRKLLLQRFIDLCNASEVKVEIILIEDDNVAKAIIELVANRNIKKLVIGTTKSNPSDKSGSRRKNAMATKVLKKAQESCEVKIICDGKEVIDQFIGRASITSSYTVNSKSPHDHQKPDKVGGLVPFMRFMPIPIWLFKPKFLSPR